MHFEFKQFNKLIPILIFVSNIDKGGVFSIPSPQDFAHRVEKGDFLGIPGQPLPALSTLANVVFELQRKKNIGGGKNSYSPNRDMVNNLNNTYIKSKQIFKLPFCKQLNFVMIIVTIFS